ncbi:MAG TPA: RsiV family protein, partial [Blastocatellia bacterium]|nr:RsiV family protein [Blastocatellia bacterium]
NYKNWNIAARSLVITLDPYQVAAFAAGDQTIRVRVCRFERDTVYSGDLSHLCLPLSILMIKH